MLFRNLYIENAEKLQDIRVEEGVITEIGEAILPREGEEQQDFGDLQRDLTDAPSRRRL